MFLSKQSLKTNAQNCFLEVDNQVAKANVFMWTAK